MKLAGVLLAVFCLTGCEDTRQGAAGERVVHFYNWADYIAPETLPAFEAETGIKVHYDVYDSPDVLEGKLLTGRSGYDLVVPTGSFFGHQRQAGLFIPIDKSLLSNYANLDPTILAKVETLDPGNRYSIPYGWGTDGLGINVEAVAKRIPNAPLDSWSLLFDPINAARLADCGITLLDSSGDVITAALIYLGHPPGSHDHALLEKAMGVVAAIRPFVRYFNSSQYVDDFANGEVCLVMGWSGSTLQAIASARPGLNLKYVIPKEGTTTWFDLLAIPADAPHVENAHALIDYLLRPEVAARFTQSMRYANGNGASLNLINPEVRDDPTIHPPLHVMARLSVAPVMSPEYVRLRNRLWTRVKTGI
jgi:putrescine transport system substrate-binding protein